MNTAALVLAVSWMAPAANDAPAEPPLKARPGAPRSGAASMGIRAEFKALDTDGNGSLSEEEYVRCVLVRQELLGADKDRDGSLTRTEFSSYVPSVMIAVPNLGRSVKRDALFEALDKDKNGEVTEAEAGQAWRLVRRMDADGDGKLAREEEIAAREKMDRAFQASRARTFDELEVSGDGVLSFAELLAPRSDIRLIGDLRAPRKRSSRSPSGSQGSRRSDADRDGKTSEEESK